MTKHFPGVRTPVREINLLGCTTGWMTSSVDQATIDWSLSYIKIVNTKLNNT